MGELDGRYPLRFTLTVVQQQIEPLGDGTHSHPIGMVKHFCWRQCILGGRTRCDGREQIQTCSSFCESPAEFGGTQEPRKIAIVTKVRSTSRPETRWPQDRFRARYAADIRGLRCCERSLKRGGASRLTPRSYLEVRRRTRARTGTATDPNALESIERPPVPEPRIPVPGGRSPRPREPAHPSTRRRHPCPPGERFCLSRTFLTLTLGIFQRLHKFHEAGGEYSYPRCIKLYGSSVWTVRAVSLREIPFTGHHEVHRKKPFTMPSTKRQTSTITRSNIPNARTQVITVTRDRGSATRRSAACSEPDVTS